MLEKDKRGPTPKHELIVLGLGKGDGISVPNLTLPYKKGHCHIHIPSIHSQIVFIPTDIKEKKQKNRFELFAEFFRTSGGLDEAAWAVG